ncbi:MAG: dimethylsulfonioproprionate lyase family protein [Parvibaculaceae bacterium]
MRAGEEAVARLVAEAKACIERLTTEREGVEAVLARLAEFDLSAEALTLPEPLETPTCSHLKAALALAATSEAKPLAEAISAARPLLHWITYDAYGPTIGPRLPKNHTFSGLVGEYRMIPATDFAMGLFLIAPRTLYRDHRHPAPELYVPLTGPTRWRFGQGAWETRHAGEPVWNEPNAVHATLVEDVPLLCLYAWTRDVMLPAETVDTPDWETIEARL